MKQMFSYIFLIIVAIFLFVGFSIATLNSCNPALNNPNQTMTLMKAFNLSNSNEVQPLWCSASGYDWSEWTEPFVKGSVITYNNETGSFSNMPYIVNLNVRLNKNNLLFAGYTGQDTAFLSIYELNKSTNNTLEVLPVNFNTSMSNSFLITPVALNNFSNKEVPVVLSKVNFTSSNYGNFYYNSFNSTIQNYIGNSNFSTKGKYFYTFSVVNSNNYKEFNIINYNISTTNFYMNHQFVWSGFKYNNTVYEIRINF